MGKKIQKKKISNINNCYFWVVGLRLIYFPLPHSLDYFSKLLLWVYVIRKPEINQELRANTTVSLQTQATNTALGSRNRENKGGIFSIPLQSLTSQICSGVSLRKVHLRASWEFQPPPRGPDIRLGTKTLEAEFSGLFVGPAYFEKKLSS